MYTERTHKVWVEISASAVKSNIKAIRSLLAPTTKLWAVIKSNAYGHGIYAYSEILAKDAVDGFCVDSVIEAVRLREQGTSQPILVIGPTLPSLFSRAAQHAITLSISNQVELDELISWQKKSEKKLEFHLKIDTGMHRRGIQPTTLSDTLASIKENNLALTGVYSHLASAKDPNDRAITESQFAVFAGALALIDAAGFKGIMRHIAATSATLTDSRYHLDAVRIGGGIYGIYPSEAVREVAEKKLTLTPTLSMRVLVSEVKELASGERIGYDLTEQVTRNTTVAILPIGYWHGIPRALSSRGTVLINGKFCKFLGIVSMDMIAVDATDTGCKVGDIATVLGSDGSNTIEARTVAKQVDTVQYEILTRLNPLIERTIVD